MKRLWFLLVGGVFSFQLLLLTCPFPLNLVFAAGSPEPPRAMWVWDARILLRSGEADRLLQFCRKENVGTLYLSAYNLEPPMEGVYRQFNRKAHQARLTVYALAGDPRWGRSRYHELPIQWVESVQRFNQTASAEEDFDGIHTDVEVYLLSKSWAERPAELLGGYLDLNAKIVALLKGHPSPLRFGVDLPFWFDDDTSYRILWHGQIKTPTAHVLDTVDAITVMAYRNFAEGPDGTVKLVNLELNYADSVGKEVIIGQETQENLFPSYVTFGGTSCESLRREMEKIQRTIGHHPSFRGFAIHHYESFRKLCRD